MQLSELCQGWMELPARFPDVEIRGLACDSRRVKPGDIFVAVDGELVDGHAYVPAAIDSGAVAIVGARRSNDPLLPAQSSVPYLKVDNSRLALGRLCDAFFGRPSEQLCTVGITGTKGKTTTSWILESLLTSCGWTPAMFGTVENRICGRSFDSLNTTPGCLDLHSWLRDHVSRGGTHAVLEVSSHAICQLRTEGIRFDGGIFTNLAPEHLDYHKTFEDYLRTKLRFFADLDRDAFVVLSRDDPASQRIARSCVAKIVWYGGELQDGVENLRLTHEGLSLEWRGVRVRSSLLGYHNVLNLLAAMSAAVEMGLPIDAVAMAASRAKAPPGRLEDVAPDCSFRVIVDYAHTDGSLEAVLEALRPVTPGRLITIFGCGGDRDRSKRARMGRVAELGSDQVIITSDNPRTEDPDVILREICEGLDSRDCVEIIPDRREAIRLGVRMAREGDTVLIAGKGHETYQEFENGTIHFDDRDVAREFLNSPELTV